MVERNRVVRVARMPEDRLSEDCFELEELDIVEPGPGQLGCRTRYLSIDAANRAWLQGATYRGAVNQGDVMAGGGIAEVVASGDPRFPVGCFVDADLGWQTHPTIPAAGATRVDVVGPLSHHVGVLGITGLTAYFGLFEVGAPRAGETVVVSAAAGAVGNVVVQLAKLAGCRVVGVAGGGDKCRWLVDELGADAAVDYKADGFYRALKAAAPGGIDVYFDNTGGDVTSAALFQMNMKGRIVCCGVVSQYDTGTPAPGPRGVPGLLVTKRLRMEGFVVMDYFADRALATRRLAAWIDTGALQPVEDIWDGIESMPNALIDLLGGGNVGKRMVAIGGEG
jgi:NADPH-dependent curcumin reductase CurA